MKIQNWDPERHLPLLSTWLQGWGQADSAGDARMYPPTGYLIDDCALGFLYQTNAPLMGYLDGFVTDPAVSARRRHSALTVLCVALTHEARQRGIQYVVAATAVRGLQRIGRDLGFEVVGNGYQYLARST